MNHCLDHVTADADSRNQNIMVIPMHHLRFLRGCRLIHKEAPRVNQLGIQYLSRDLQRKVFPKSDPDSYLQHQNEALLKLSQHHLEEKGLFGKKTQISDPIDIKGFPELVGKNTLDEHFTRVGDRYSQPYLGMAEAFLDAKMKLPKKPVKWLFQSGWTRYVENEAPEKVDFPKEDEIVFDVEVLYKKANYAVLCTAVSSTAWYGWVSPLLTKYDPDCENDYAHLIPFDTHSAPKLLIGYNVSYDRARILEEYSLKQLKAYYLDAMALHIAVSGFCSQQRPTYQKHRKHKLAAEASETEEEFIDEQPAAEVAQELMDDPWLNKGAPNSLANVAEFHCGIEVDKDLRDTFSSENPQEVIDMFQDLMGYCANDVDVTYQVAKKLFPEFRAKNPHPVTFAALRHLGLLFLPTTRKWEKYIETSENIYLENRALVTKILQKRARELVRWIEKDDEKLKPDTENDPWIKQLNWTLKETRLKKDGTPSAKQAYLVGYPEWYRDLFKSAIGEDGEKQLEMNLSVRTRITPLLLRLKWEGNPLIWTESAGWCFKVPYEDGAIEGMKNKNYTVAHLSDEDLDILLPELRDGVNAFELFKVPHPDGPSKRCTQIMSKSYLRYFESGVLTSEYEYAREILNLNATASYWMGNRARISDQFVVYADAKGHSVNFFDTKKEAKLHSDMGMILPKLCTMGTITRRATENTWLTASNSKANRIGSELKAMIQPPKGYAFVGADVDSEELWIASLIGDSLFNIHGGTALGWMTLEGDKNEKTDLHSRTADIMGISRNDSKVFNYGRIYGAGVKFATRLLKQCNSNLSDEEAAEKATALYQQTKGTVSHSKVLGSKVYHGGTESVMFNVLEKIAGLESPRTPVLGASITDALTRKNLNKNSYLTSRINWTIQSSGVDYLHLLIVSMEYLMEKYKVNARLMITVHDELRYMVADNQKLQCAMLLQIANVWTRAMFCEQMGIKELPQSCAFFSEVDVDHVLRKEVSMDCVTPSHPDSLSPGESYNIRELQAAIGDMGFLEQLQNSLQNIRNKFVPRTSFLDTLDQDQSKEIKVALLKLQTSKDKDEWRSNMTEYMDLQRLQERQDLEAKTHAAKKPRVRKPKKNEEEFLLGRNGQDELLRRLQGGHVYKEGPKLAKPRKSSAINGFGIKQIPKVAGTVNIGGVSKNSTNPKRPAKVSPTTTASVIKKSGNVALKSTSLKRVVLLTKTRESLAMKEMAAGSAVNPPLNQQSSSASGDFSDPSTWLSEHQANPNFKTSSTSKPQTTTFHVNRASSQHVQTPGTIKRLKLPEVRFISTQSKSTPKIAQLRFIGPQFGGRVLEKKGLFPIKPKNTAKHLHTMATQHHNVLMMHPEEVFRRPHYKLALKRFRRRRH